MPATTQKGDEHTPMESIQGHKVGFHSEFTETLRHLLRTLNVGRSQMQAPDCVDPQQVPLTGYENFQQEIQTYPVARDPVTVQPSAPNNTNNSGLLDLPNVNVNLPPPLAPQQMNQVHPVMSRPIQQQTEVPIVTSSISSSEILESIQSIMKVIQQQLLFSSKTAKQGIIQNASLFQEMIKAQEKRDLDPALLAIPTFLEEPE